VNEQEAQQAQTIADARKWAAEESAWLSRQKLPQSESVEHMDGVLQIVDSQAQKIAEARNEAKYWRDRAVGTLHPRDRGKVNPLPWVDGP